MKALTGVILKALTRGNSEGSDGGGGNSEGSDRGNSKALTEVILKALTGVILKAI